MVAGKSNCRGDAMAKGGEVKCSTCGKMNCMAHGGEYAEGGSVRSGKQRHNNEKGVHSESFSYDKPGKSDTGVYIRSHGTGSEKSKGLIKTEHKDIMGQLDSMPNPKLKGLAEGGEVDDMGEMDEHDMDSMDNEIMDMVADELMEAIDKKDKKGIVEAIKALVMSCKE